VCTAVLLGIQSNYSLASLTDMALMGPAVRSLPRTRYTMCDMQAVAGKLFLSPEGSFASRWMCCRCRATCLRVRSC
jgi:hypothetical protein